MKLKESQTEPPAPQRPAVGQAFSLLRLFQHPAGMKMLLIFMLAVVPVAAQNAVARIVNTTHPGSDSFQVGDTFEILVTGAANQPISVRTMRQGRTDWSPVVGWTSVSGEWSTTGKFEKADFGSWSEVWTVGGELANRAVSFSVTGPCIPGGRGMTSGSGPNMVLSCETAAGMQTFVTPSFGDPFRTPDGRLISGDRSPEQVMGNLIEDSGGHSGQQGDDAAALITKVIGENILDDREIRNVLSIVRLAFQNRNNVVPPASNPATLLLLQNLERTTEQASLKKEISEAMAFVQGQ